MSENSKEKKSITIGIGEGLGRDFELERVRSQEDGTGIRVKRKYPDKEIDFEACKDLDIKRVMRDIGCTFDETHRRWSMPGETHSEGPKIEIKRDGGWVHYKCGTGGGPIELVRFWKRGDYDSSGQKWTGLEHVKAAEWLCEKYGLWKSYEHLKEKKKRLIGTSINFDSIEDDHE